MIVFSSTINLKSDVELQAYCLVSKNSKMDNCFTLKETQKEISKKCNKRVTKFVLQYNLLLDDSALSKLHTITAQNSLYRSQYKLSNL